MADESSLFPVVEDDAVLEERVERELEVGRPEIQLDGSPVEPEAIAPTGAATGPDAAPVSPWADYADMLLIGGIALLVLGGLLVAWLVLRPAFRLRRKARGVGLHFSLWRAVKLAHSDIEAEKLLAPWGRLRHARIKRVSFGQLVAHAEAGGSVHDVVEAMLKGHRQELRLEWDLLCQMDLEGEKPAPIVTKTQKPWRLEIPGDLLGGDAIPATAGDGVELRVRGVAEVLADPSEDQPTPRTAAMASEVAQVIARCVANCRDHRELLDYPARLTDAVAQAKAPSGTGIKMLKFEVERIDLARPAAEPATPQATAEERGRARAQLDRLVGSQRIERMSPAELAKLAPAYLEYGNPEEAERVCRVALAKDPKHERAHWWLYEAMHQAGRPLELQLMVAEGCLERHVEPRTAWRLIRASILCQMATETDRRTGAVKVVDADRYKEAAKELRSMLSADARLMKEADEHGWIDDWSAAFPGLPEASAERRSRATAE